ncbi:transglycosylase [Hyphomicrobium denitrificans 1NES1]|uniref:Transglycosylase n=1 Tax=Hyphomicrobium denitrificans 1NES1 TaxID=670307 RepID=N0B7H8_9HYPH|nr:transglycosylase [Hyphomicrobium denitrificans 1NES1]
MDIDLQSLIVWLLIGAIAGWLAGQIMKGGGFGLVGDIIVGIVGAFIAGVLFPRLGFAFGNPLVGSIIAAVVGACLLLFILRLVRRGT